jgi:RNA-binding protein 39
MSGLDVEALLDSTANSKEQAIKATANGNSPPQNGDRDGRLSRPRDTSRDRDRERDRKRGDRSSHRDSVSETGRDTPRSDAGSHKSRRRSRSRDSDRRHSRRHRDGDYYRSRGGRSRSRSPTRYYRPRGDDRRDHRDDRSYRRRDDDKDDRRGARHSSARAATPPPLTEDERDRRTVFVQQLAARLRTRELKDFFEKVGPVAEAQIVKDRVSNRSKG